MGTLRNIGNDRAKPREANCAGTMPRNRSIILRAFMPPFGMAEKNDGWGKFRRPPCCHSQHYDTWNATATGARVDSREHDLAQMPDAIITTSLQSQVSTGIREIWEAGFLYTQSGPRPDEVCERRRVEQCGGRRRLSVECPRQRRAERRAGSRGVQEK